MNEPPGNQQASSPGDRQLLHLNHCYGVLDETTADAVGHSGYLRTFGGCRLRTTSDGGRTWTGRYLMGRATYLELFKVGEFPGPESGPGSAGLGLSVERAGELRTVVEQLPSLGVPTPAESRKTRDFGDGAPIPWFREVAITQTCDTFRAWAMEYEESYFADPRSKTKPARTPGDVGRERYLDDYYRPCLLRDVTAVTFAVTANDLAGTVPLLLAGGLAVRERPEGVVAWGNGVMVRFDAVPRASAGLREVEMTLTEPVSRPHVEKVGGSTLTVGPGRRAVWTFPATGW